MILTPPSPLTGTLNQLVIFLAGSIEMGSADNWQTRVAKALPEQWCILNPRREDWDASWEQSKDNPKFREQVEWELSGLEYADIVLFYFQPGTQSPISLLELGLCARSEMQTIMVVCPDGFWRKGNVDLVCERYGIKQFATLEEVIERLKS